VADGLFQLHRLRPLWRLVRLLRLLPLLSLPSGWLADHGRAYGQLAGLELSREWAWWRRGLLLRVLGGLGLFLALGLAGVALMLWAVVPPAQVHAPWMLWLVPLALAVPTLVCLWRAALSRDEPAFGAVRRQLRADMALFRTPGEEGPHSAAAPGSPRAGQP
jgi:uncharacterized membrane protein YqjE